MIHSLSSPLPLTHFNNERVLLRADLNVPIADGQILSDHRLTALLPTIDMIFQHHGRIILCTHIGRPRTTDTALSTQHLIPWFKKQGYDIVFEPDLEQAHAHSILLKERQILLLENLRFFPGETKNSIEFARQLRHTADWYVNDAFGVLHRTNCSTTIVPRLFPLHQRMIGLLIEQELKALHKLLDTSQRPLLLILGGGKVADKIPVMRNLLPHVHAILLCPAIVFSFLKADNKPVGISLVDDMSVPLCKEIMDQAHQNGIHLVFPIDYQVAEGSFSGKLSYCTAAHFPDTGVGISIGPDTVELFARYIRQAGSIFYNGTMGTLARPETLDGMRSILHLMATSDAYTVLGGGDSAGVALTYGFADHLDYISTGGGATLAYLGGEELPGLEVFLSV